MKGGCIINTLCIYHTRYNLDFKTLKNCMQEDEKELIENIRKIYFEIGIGDK